MTARFYPYDPERDFIRVRDFLVETFPLTDRPLNWRLERWNYSRYFITPLLATDSVSEPDLAAYRAAIRLFNASTGLWQDQAGQVVGVVNIEHADRGHRGWGEAFVQHHPDYDALLPEMLDFAEDNLRDRARNRLFVPVYDHDEALLALLQARGYRRNDDYTLWDSVFTIEGALPDVTLPGGYRLQSMADDNDLDRRRKAFGLGFDHADPRDWPSLLSCQELQHAPDYRHDLDLHVVAADGEFVSFCIAWWDERNRLASLEPVGTVAEHRRKGLARAVVLEAIRRVAALGAEQVFVGSDQAFYRSVGFRLTYAQHHWEKMF
ncbi:MAG: GNAT family N-acetyltransferase [Anaerolineae bacterium]|jgi:predicted N-acetyltransferase YhbS